MFHAKNQPFSSILSGINQGGSFYPPPPPIRLTSMKKPIRNRVKTNNIGCKIFTFCAFSENRRKKIKLLIIILIINAFLMDINIIF